PFAAGPLLVAPGSPGAVRLEGTVHDGDGAPVPDALVEIRQADASGAIPTGEGSWRRERGFTGWGRAATDASGRYAFTTVEPGPTAEGAAPFFSVCVFARGLLDRLFTRAYLPSEATDGDAFLAGLGDACDRLVVVREGDALRFDIHLQGEHETPFLAFPRHEA
ncbi:MAG TPA: protocatechuate 3,4-dioxygenase subunit alpha, partial [Nocardioides sp.]